MNLPALAGLMCVATLGALFHPGGQPGVQPDKPQPGPEAGVPGPLPPGFPGEHRLLAELTGNFNVTIKTYAADGKMTGEVEGAAVRSSALGSRFLKEQLDAPGAVTPFSMETTFGFNPDGKEGERFELVRLSSAAFPMMLERGAFDNSTKVFTFAGQYLADGKVAKSRTVYRLEAHMTHVLEVFVAYEDASTKPLAPEFKAYSIEYRRSR